MISRLTLVLVSVWGAALWCSAPALNTMLPVTSSTPTVCPSPEHKVIASVDATTVHVGDEFVLHSTSTGYAGLAHTYLFIGRYQLAIVPADLENESKITPPQVEVLPTSTGSTLGSAEFVLRALQPGVVEFHTSVYGDAYFYSSSPCQMYTSFRWIDSAPVEVVIEP